MTNLLFRRYLAMTLLIISHFLTSKQIQQNGKEINFLSHFDFLI